MLIRQFKYQILCLLNKNTYFIMNKDDIHVRRHSTIAVVVESNGNNDAMQEEVSQRLFDLFSLWFEREDDIWER